MKILYLIVVVLLTSCNKTFPLKINKEYRIDFNSNEENCLLDRKNIIRINGKILRYSSNSSYVYFEQKPFEAITKGGKNLEERQLIFEKSNLLIYYVLNKKNDILSGPISQNEFKLRYKNYLELKWINLI